MLRRNLAVASIAFALSAIVMQDAAALAQRTFVASYGAPANTAFNCSIAKPCRAFSEAIGVTLSGGEVIVLDSAGYGTVAIAKSVSIIAPSGVYAGITVFSGTGVTVGGTNIDVVLRGLTINGQGGDYGITFDGAGGSLLVDDCNISGMNTNGVFASAGQLRVRNTVLHNTSGGVQVNGLPAGTATATLSGVHISGGQAGAVAVNAAQLTITDSTIVDATEVAVVAIAGVGTTDVMVSHTAISGTKAAFQVGGAGPVTRLVADANSINNISNFVFEFIPGGPAIVYSPGNNSIGFNNGIVSGGSLTTPCCTH